VVKLIAWIINLILVALAMYGMSKDAIDSNDLIGTILWCTWAPLLIAVVLSFTKASLNQGFWFITGTYAGTALTALVLLSFISYAVYATGPLDEGAIMLIVFPLAFLKAGTVHKYSYSTGWKNVPGYGKSEDLFPLKDGFKPWFGIFSDAIGISLLFYYPRNPSGVIEVPYHGVDLGGFKVYWRHGIPGLSKIMQVIYFEWLLRNYSYSVAIET